MSECTCGAENCEGKATCVRCGRCIFATPCWHLPHDLPEGLPKTGRETDKEK